MTLFVGRFVAAIHRAESIENGGRKLSGTSEGLEPFIYSSVTMAALGADSDHSYDLQIFKYSIDNAVFPVMEASERLKWAGARNRINLNLSDQFPFERIPDVLGEMLDVFQSVGGEYESMQGCFSVSAKNLLE